MNIAQRALELHQEPQLKPYVDLPRMAACAQRMVKESLDAFVSRDTELARRVCAEDAEVDALKQTLLAMGGLVEDQIRRVMRALVERDDEQAKDVIARDREVNAYENEIDEKCVELLALHQPAAGDLRFLTTAMKIVTDLERIGDQAVNIAQRALELNREPQLKPYIDLPRMAEKAQAMVKESLDAFVARDTVLARRVRAEDEAVDALNHQIFRELLTFTMSDPTTIPRAIRLILIARFLERVADHATNIAEMVIYLVESRMVRHTVS